MSIQIGKDEDGRFYILRDDAIVTSCKDYDEARFKAGVKAQAWREPAELREVVRVWTVLGRSVAVLEVELGTGRYDADLVALASAEQAGRNRKSALAAIRARSTVIS